MEEYTMNAGDTAFILLCAAFVFIMTPGLAFFYGGMVRRKNVGNTMMQCVFIMGVSVIMWVLVGYALSFGGNHAGIIGGAKWFGFNGVGMKPGPYADTIPNLAFAAFQMMFAMITPALITGSVAGRMKFKALVLFIILWSLIVYYPMAHMVWGEDGFLAALGSVDFAGGNVVHISSGVSALVLAICLGRRRGYEHTSYRIHNIPFVTLGASLLWFGWFGFNAGSGLCADGIAANAFLVTHLATCVAALTWMAIDWIYNKKPTTVGACTGAVSGLVAITPAAGSTGILGAFFIGLITPIVCFYMVAVIKPKLKYDDTLDAFGVHGVGGIIGSILTGVFATRFITGEEGAEGALYGDWHQLWIQVAATLISIVFSAVMTYLLFKVTDRMIGIRVDKRVEEEGLDIYEHGESAYNR